MLQHCLTSLLAGLVIGIAGCSYILIRWINDGVVFNLIGSIIFSFGLVVICKYGLYLFTGKIGMIFETGWNETGNKVEAEDDCSDDADEDTSDDQHDQHDQHDSSTSTPSTPTPTPTLPSNITHIHLLSSLVLNLIASFSFGILCGAILGKTNFISITKHILSSKISFSHPVDSTIQYLLQGIYCGVCVHSAVKTFKMSFLFCVFFISLFVFSGFQHCIANSFYFGVMFKQFNLKMFLNECIVIVGNIIGTIPIALIANRISK